MCPEYLHQTTDGVFGQDSRGYRTEILSEVEQVLLKPCRSAVYVHCRFSHALDRHTFFNIAHERRVAIVASL